MERAEKGVVLQGSWQGLPRSTARRVCTCGDHLCAVRLQCWVRQLDGRLVSSQKKLGVAKMQARVVLPQQEGALELDLLGRHCWSVPKKGVVLQGSWQGLPRQT